MCLSQTESRSRTLGLRSQLDSLIGLSSAFWRLDDPSSIIVSLFIINDHYFLYRPVFFNQMLDLVKLVFYSATNPFVSI